MTLLAFFMNTNWKEIIEVLAEHGCDISIRAAGGMFTAQSAFDVEQWMQDKDGFTARANGTTVERVRSWKAFHEEGCRCRATTKKGTQCNNWCEGDDVDKFVPGISDRCHLHIGMP